MNRYQDALAVLGTENKSLVDQIEQKLAEAKIERSDVAALITRSVEEVDKKTTKSLTEIESELEGLDKPTLISLLKKMTSEGDIEEDDLSENINEMANAMTDKSTVEKTTVEKTTVEKTINLEVQITPKITDTVEPKSEQKEVTMETQETPVVNSPLETKLDELIGLLKNNIPATANASVVTPEPVVEPVVTDIPAWKSIVKEFESALEDGVVNKSGAERQAAFQGVMDFTANKLKELYTQLETKSTPENINLETLKSMVSEQVSQATQTLSSENAVIKQSVNDLANTISQLTASLQTAKPVNRSVPVPVPVPVPAPRPVSRGITTVPPQVQKSNANKPLSIAEIAKKTVF